MIHLYSVPLVVASLSLELNSPDPVALSDGKEANEQRNVSTHFKNQCDLSLLFSFSHNKVRLSIPDE